MKSILYQFVSSSPQRGTGVTQNLKTMILKNFITLDLLSLILYKGTHKYQDYGR